MVPEAICCGQCSWPVPVESWNQSGGVRCPGCGQTIRVAVFPAIARTRTGAAPEALQAETEASCFYHPESRASIPCDECGRFLCGYAIWKSTPHLCPACFVSGVANRKLETVETRRTMHDTMALTLATFPMLLFWPALITAPAALFVAIRRWRARAAWSRARASDSISRSCSRWSRLSESLPSSFYRAIAAAVTIP